KRLEIDRAISEINELILETAQKAEIKKARKTNFYTLSSSIRKSIRVRNRLRKDWQRTRDPAIKNRYVHYCGEVKKQIYDFRDFTWRNLLEGLEIKDNSLWDFTKRITRKNTNFPPFEINGNQITDDQQKAEILAKTYEKQFTPSESKIPDFHRRTNAVMGNYVKSERKNYLK
ncbi:hypothetical protein JGG64_23600, partial [Salmonella enterica subsp. enterica serovar Derby]|nr:hypothetical protein [Salmonella enterica subsp. enterica serovar Derby]